jgi:hypothetical protein
MPEIIISVKNKIPSVIGDTRTIVTDNSDYTIRFIFDEQWDESEKVVYLIRSNGYAYPPISTTDDVVEVPVQHKAGLGAFLLVGIQQGNIKTSAAAHIAIRASAIDAIDDEAVQPSAALWNEVLRRLRDVEESISPEELERIVNEYLKENPITESVKSVNGQTGEVKLNAADVGALPASTQIPGKTSDLQNDSGFITRLVSDLANYYTKNQTYSREEVDARVSAIPKFSISVVSSLPTSNISETTVYLVKAGSASGDMYTEYIRANGAWEILGSQRVDLTGYATEDWVNTRIADLVTAESIKTALGYTPADAEELNSKLDADKLPEAVNDALAQAKESGEFDGKDGNSGVYVGSEETMPKGTKVRIDPNGRKVEIPQIDATLTKEGYAADAKAVGDALDAMDEQIAEIAAGADISLGITGAAVGQIPQVSAVDKSGVPIAWLPADFPSGGGGEWALMKEITLDSDVSSINIYFSPSVTEVLVIHYGQAGYSDGTAVTSAFTRGQVVAEGSNVMYSNMWGGSTPKTCYTYLKAAGGAVIIFSWSTGDPSFSASPVGTINNKEVKDIKNIKFTPPYKFVSGVGDVGIILAGTSM